MNAKQWLDEATEKLEAASIGTARLDALVLLEDKSHKDRSWLLAHPEFVLNNTLQRRLDNAVKRRTMHEPLAYIRGFSEFYGRKFSVNKAVLEPRPESETMIDLLKHLPLPSRPKIADVGSGSGALGITAALELAKAEVHLFELDPNALAVALGNARKHKLTLLYFAGDLLTKNSGPYDVLLSNLPYVPDSFALNDAAANEPKLAIFGGKDGLDIYRRLFMQLATFSWQPTFVLTESLPMQHEKLVGITQQTGYKLHSSQDFIQVFTPSLSGAGR